MADPPKNRPRLSRRRRLLIWLGAIAALAGGMYAVWDGWLDDHVIPKRWGRIAPGVYRSGMLEATLVKQTLERHDIDVLIQFNGQDLSDAKQKAMEERDQWRERATAAENRKQVLEQQLARWEADRDHQRLCQRLRHLESQLAHQTHRAERAEQRACAPADASTGPANETQASATLTATAEEPACPDLRGNCVLCVGGRKQVRDHYRRVVEAANGRFLHHDGGIEQGSSHLAQMLERADQVVCPVDCVGHQAVRCVKNHCRRKGTPCRFLDSASVTALSRALPQLPVARPAADR